VRMTTASASATAGRPGPAGSSTGIESEGCPAGLPISVRGSGVAEGDLATTVAGIYVVY
jgi:hypothetical protein